MLEARYERLDELLARQDREPENGKIKKGDKQ
jgi:hypothetical protein